MLAPLAHSIDVRRLVIVPDGALYHVPFTGLPLSERSSHCEARTSGGATVAAYTTDRSNSNCVITQESFYVSPSSFAPGLFQVYAAYYDGNAEDLYIPDEVLGTLDVR